MYSSRVSLLIAQGIRHGVRYYEAMEPTRRSSGSRFGVLFNEATQVGDGILGDLDVGG